MKKEPQKAQKAQNGFNGEGVFQPPIFGNEGPSSRRGRQECPPSCFKSVKICVICGLFIPPLPSFSDNISGTLNN